MPANPRVVERFRSSEAKHEKGKDVERVLMEIFKISEDMAEKCTKGETALGHALNVKKSREAVIAKFVVPLLTNALGFERTDIVVVPSQKNGSDVVVMKENMPLLLIEAEPYGEELSQGQPNAETLRFEYAGSSETVSKPLFLLRTNVVETHIYETNSGEEVEFSPVFERDVPKLLDKLSNILGKPKLDHVHTSRDSRTERLPVRDQRDFQRLLFSCQNDMREGSVPKTGIAAFSEMNKLLSLKIHEDRRERVGKENRFTTRKVEMEGPSYISKVLFESVKQQYAKDGVDTFQTSEDISLDDSVVNSIVERLEKVLLVDELGNVYPPIAHVYENFVGTVFRGDNGQYFTPRNIVEFVIEIARVEYGSVGRRVIDPTCGSGGFLLAAFAALDRDLRRKYFDEGTDGIDRLKPVANFEEYQQARRKLSSRLLVGVDNEETVARTAAMNLSVHGDGDTCIHHGDSLLIDSLGKQLPENTFEYALTNPPFSTAVKPGTRMDSDGRDLLEKYELGHKHSYNRHERRFRWSSGKKDLRQQDSKVLFIERCHRLLKDGGVLGIVVDDGVLNNPTDDYVRDFIFRKFIVDAVVALPYDSFKEQDAHNYTSVLFLRKKREGVVQGNIFMAIAQHVGETYGKSTTIMPNDLKKIAKDYIAYLEGKDGELSEFSFVVGFDEIENFYDEGEKRCRNRLDPKFYHPRRKEIERKIEKTGTARQISSIVDFRDEICPRDRLKRFGAIYIEKITKDGYLEYDTFSGNGDPKGVKDRIFRAGDLVASRINLKSGMITLIPEELAEVLGTGEYYRLEPRITDNGAFQLSREYLRIILTLEPVQFLMNARASGQYGRLSDSELSRIRIPVPSTEVQNEIAKEYKSNRSEIDQKLQDVEKMAAESERALTERIFSEIRKK